MEQPTAEELARVRAWLEWVRESPSFTAPAATFSLAPGVLPTYGDVTSPHLSDEQGLLDYMVAFANLKPRELFKELPEGADEEIQAAQRAELESIERRQALFVPLLSAVASDLEEARNRFLPAVKKLLQKHVWSLPALRGGGHHDIISDDAGLYAFVGELLLERGFGRILLRCPVCSKLWFVRSTGGSGRTRWQTCSEKCGKASHDSKSGERRRRSRAIQILEPRYGRERSRDVVERAFEAHPEATVKELAEYARTLLRNTRKRQ